MPIGRPEAVPGGPAEAQPRELGVGRVRQLSRRRTVVPDTPFARPFLVVVEGVHIHPEEDPDDEPRHHPSPSRTSNSRTCRRLGLDTVATLHDLATGTFTVWGRPDRERNGEGKLVGVHPGGEDHAPT